MSKGRKRSKAQRAANAAKFRMLPPPGGFCGGGPPHLVSPHGPVMLADHFHMRPPNCGPPIINDGPFINEPPEFVMRELNEHGPGFHPQEFETHPRFHHPHMEDRPRCFHPDLYENRPGFHPLENDCGTLRFVPPEFQDRPPGFVTPVFRDGPPRFSPEFRDGPSRFVPHDLRDRPPRFVPHELRDRPPRFVPLELRDGASVAGIWPSPFVAGPGQPRSTVNPEEPLDFNSNIAPMAPCPPHRSHELSQQSSAPDNNGNSNSTPTTTETSTPKKETSLVKHMFGSVKPPPGQSLGVITFISSSYGFIEREDLKKYSFSFDAFFGKRNHLVPGVKVHFTAVKELKKEFATDVKVAPGGTEEIECTVYEGVVTAVLPESYVLEAQPGRIRTILTTETVKLPFGKMDSKATLLLFDRVKFQLCTDIITKVRRATNITPQMPETFQLTKETREKGVIMNVKDDSCTVMSKKHENLTVPLSEYLSAEQLKVMDEVEFTVVTVKAITKAIRLKKLPDGLVEFESKLKVTNPSACKSMWKPVTSKEAADHEDISSEKFDGTISRVIPQCSEKEMGRVDTTVADARKSLPFGLGDVITKATMMVGDKVQFNIVTNKQTKEERAVNIAIQPETFQQEPTAQRRIGMVIKLDSNCGFIRTQQDPKLVFDLSELMDDTKLNLSEKVEFTLAVGPKEGAEGKRAVRVRKLTESVFTPVPKLEEKKEKKKMTIKLLKDPKELIQKIKTEAIEKTSSDKAEASKAPKQNNKDKQENLTKGSRERTRSSRSSSHSRDRSSSHYGKRRSSSRDRSFQSHRRSRSRSRERSRTYRRRYSHSRSRSRSRERGTQSGKKRSHSPERRHPTNKEFRSPDGKNKTSKYTASYLQDTTSPSTQTVKIEIENKRKELLALNELIARKKAIIAMEQNTKMASQFKDALEVDGQHGIATFDYQHKHCLENSWTPDMKPVKSILKKQYESSTGPQHQKVERSDCSEEAAGSPHPSVSSIYMSPGTVPVWVKQSTTPEINDQELARKKRQLEELSEIIARKRAIIAMEQKVLCDGSEIKKKYDFASCSDDLDITVTNKNIWQLEIKPDLQPKKSILKKRSESVPDPPQKNLPSAGQYALFPISKQPTDDKSAILNPSEPSDASFKKPCNPPSIILNTFDLFKKLINESPVSSFTSKQSFNPSSGLLYDQKHSRESQDQWYSTVPSQISKFPNQNCEESSSTSDCSSASIQKSNLATQMERFLGALNKAGSNLMSSLLKDARKDSDLQESQMMAQGQAERGVSGGDELYDPFKETDCNEDYPLMGSKQKRKSLFGQIENIQDDLLPHERAVVDGSGFSKIVGMKHGIEAKAENRSLYEEAIPSSSQGRFVEERKMFLKACDAFKLSSDRYSDELYYDDSKYVEDRESYQRPKTDRHSVEGSLSSEQQMSGDAYEEVDQKASQYKTIQDLLQTIGLNLDTTEVRKLADRTNERLYGKKGKLQRASSFHHKDERSTSRYDRRGSSHSTGSEGVCSVSPVKPSERKVYMSYLDSIKCHDEEASVEGRDMLTIKRTIRNSPEAKQTTPEPYIKPPEALHDSCNSTAGTFSVPQTVGSQYSQISSEYAIGGQQNPYGSVPVNPLNYSTGYSIPPPPFPPGYQNYTASVSMMPPSPAQFYPPFTMSPFTTSGTFDPSPSSPYPSTLGQFGFAMPSGSSGYATQLVKTKAAPLSRCLKTIQTVQSQNSLSVKVSAAEEMRTVISIKTQNDLKYTDCEAESQLTPVTEDDIKAKQKKRLEQFNQRMRLKKEQQMEAQRTRGLSQKSAPGNVMKTEVKNVWICGHSLVFWAEKRATSPEIGMQLGMDPNSVHIWWKGMQGMTWQQLLPQLLQLKDNWPKPDVIIIHLGGNDIGNMTPENFVLVVKKDVISLRNIFPQCCLVWSDILPRKSWRHSDDSTTVNNMRHAVNKTIHGIMAKIGGSSLTHDNILPGLDSGLYRPDGVHLSGKGIDTFNLNMQDFLEKWEYEISETETSESKTKQK